MNTPMVFFKLLIVSLFFWQTEVPSKPKEEYKIELEYKFKQRSSFSNVNRLEVDNTGEEKKKYGEGSLPYLMINFSVIKLAPEEIRIKVVNSMDQTMMSRKVKEGEVYKLDLGFTDDMKDRVTAHEFNIYLQNEKKKEISVVKLFIGEDGTFLINGEVRGKF